MKRLIIILGGLLLLVLSGCASKDQAPKPVGSTTLAEGPPYPVTISNYKSDRSSNQEIFYSKPGRVVVNQQNAIETLLELKQEKQIIAASCTSGHTTELTAKYRQQLAGLPQINRFDFDLETVLMLEPDFIIGWQSTFSKRILRSTDFWNQRGVNTYIVENSNSILPKGRVEDEYTFITNMGRVFNVEDQAQAYIKTIEAEVAEAVAYGKDKPPQKTIIIESMGNLFAVYGSNKLGGDMVTKLGGQIIDGGRLGAENLIALDPEVIFVVCIGWQEDAEACVRAIENNRALGSIKAVKNKRIYPIPLMYMYASATRTLDGIRVFKAGLYPELAAERKI